MIKAKDGTVAPDRSKGSARKTRTASPSGKEAVGRVGAASEGVPAKKARPPASAEGPFIPTTYSLDQGLIDRVTEWAHVRRVTKSAAARALLEKALK